MATALAAGLAPESRRLTLVSGLKFGIPAILVASALIWAVVTYLGGKTNGQVLSATGVDFLSFLGAAPNKGGVDALVVAIERERDVFRFLVARPGDGGPTYVGWGWFNEDTLTVTDTPGAPSGMGDLVPLEAKARCLSSLFGIHARTAEETKKRTANLYTLLRSGPREGGYTIEKYPDPVAAENGLVLGDIAAYALWSHCVQAGWFSKESIVNVVRIYRRPVNALADDIALKDRLSARRWTFLWMITDPRFGRDRLFWGTPGLCEVDVSTLECTAYPTD
jgi:hypothetical protein